MKQISAVVRDIVGRHPLIQNAMAADILNYSAAARKILPEVEAVLKERPDLPAILAALKRMDFDESKIRDLLELKRILLKSDLTYIAFKKNPDSASSVESMRKKARFDAGDTFVETVGNYEINVVADERVAKELLNSVEEKNVLKYIENVCQLSVNISEKMTDTPGMIAAITRYLAASNVNILDCFSTFTEFSVMVHKNQAQKAFLTLQELVEESKKKK